MPLTTETGREFANADEALAYIRVCQEKMFDRGASLMESSIATTEMVYAFKSLDEYLRRGGSLPGSWARP